MCECYIKIFTISSKDNEVNNLCLLYGFEANVPSIRLVASHAREPSILSCLISIWRQDNSWVNVFRKWIRFTNSIAAVKFITNISSWEQMICVLMCVLISALFSVIFHKTKLSVSYMNTLTTNYVINHVWLFLLWHRLQLSTTNKLFCMALFDISLFTCLDNKFTHSDSFTVKTMSRSQLKP